jgi:hypothetical protein
MEICLCTHILLGVAVEYSVYLKKNKIITELSNNIYFTTSQYTACPGSNRYHTVYSNIYLYRYLKNSKIKEKMAFMVVSKVYHAEMNFCWPKK